MSRTVLFPYPRLSAGEVRWSNWTITVDSHQTEVNEVSDKFDADSVVIIQISATLDLASLPDVGVERAHARLLLYVACRDTAFSVSAETHFVEDATTATASASVSLEGRAISQALDLAAHVIGPLDPPCEHAWLSRRIIAVGPNARVPLDSDLTGFPTAASSFSESGIPDAPWRIVVTADDLATPFAHSVRLELNEDYPAIRDLMDGKGTSIVHDELNASIARVLISTVSALSSSSPLLGSLEHVSAEEPDSITAAAQRASKQFLNLNLSAAVKELRVRPERFEYLLANGTGILRRPR